MAKNKYSARLSKKQWILDYKKELKNLKAGQSLIVMDFKANISRRMFRTYDDVDNQANKLGNDIDIDVINNPQKRKQKNILNEPYSTSF